MLPNNQEIKESLRRATGDAAPSSDLLRFARAVWCDEIPGLAFGIFTLAWILMSFAGLAGFDLKPVGHEMIVQVHRLALHLPSHTATILSRTGAVAGFARRAWDLFAAQDGA